jgi:hypothetical protein
MRAMTIGLCGALVALPLGAAGLYTVHQGTLSAEASCRDLRASILSTLEKTIDPATKRALVHKDLTEFERSCALRDPQAQAVYAALDRIVLFTGVSDAERASPRPVRFGLRPPVQGYPDARHRWPGLLPPPEPFRNRPFGT